MTPANHEITEISFQIMLSKNVYFCNISHVLTISYTVFIYFIDWLLLSKYLQIILSKYLQVLEIKVVF